MTSRSSNLNNVQLISSREAADLVGYTTDYIARLAREGKIVAKRNGSQWVIDKDSIKLFALEAEAEKRNRKANLRDQRLEERAQTIRHEHEEAVALEIKRSSFAAWAQTAVVSVCLFLLANIVWFAFESDLDTGLLSDGIESIVEDFSVAVIDPNLEFLSQSASLAFIGKASDKDTSKDFFIYESTAVDGADQSEVIGSILTDQVEEATGSKDLQKVFSDEVEVEFRSDGTGVVTPIFRDDAGETYSFQLTPEMSKERNN